MTLKRLGSPDISISVEATPSNYSRNLAGPSEIAIEGREFVISKNFLVAPITIIKRGDRLVDPELGIMTISESNELYDLGGSIIGFRVRTS